jgi:hypothetical protein
MKPALILLAACLAAATATVAPPAAAELPASSANSQAIGRMLAQAGDEAAAAHVAAMADITTQLLDGHAVVCARLLVPERYGQLAWDDLPAPQRARLQASLATLDAAAKRDPQPTPGEAEAGPILDRVYDAMAARYGEEAVEPLGNPTAASEADLCRAWSRLFTETARLPANEGGRMARWLLSP